MSKKYYMEVAIPWLPYTALVVAEGDTLEELMIDAEAGFEDRDGDIRETVLVHEYSTGLERLVETYFKLELQRKYGVIS